MPKDKKLEDRARDFISTDSLEVQGGPPGEGLTEEQKREFDNYWRGKGMSKKFVEENYGLHRGLSISPDMTAEEIIRRNFPAFAYK